MRMKIKPGYKQTEIGVIPEEWGMAELQEKSKIIDSLHQTPVFSDDGYSMVRVSDIKTGNLRLDGTMRVSKKIFTEFTKNYSLKRSDIVLSRVVNYGVSSFVETSKPFCMGKNTVVIESVLPPHSVKTRNAEKKFVPSLDISRSPRVQLPY